MPGPSNPAMNWSFVITSASQEVKDRERRRIVRANAMRDYWRRKKLAARDASRATEENSDQDDGTPTRSTESLVEDDPNAASRGEQGTLSRSARSQYLALEYQTNTSSRKGHSRSKDVSLAAPHEGDTNAVKPTHMGRHDQRRRSNHTSLQETFVPSPSERLGSGVTDPFDALPVGGSQNCYVLHNRSIVVSVVEGDSTLRVNHRGQEIFMTKMWLPYALQDPALYLCTLTFAVGYLDMLGFNDQYSNRLSYKGLTINAVNTRLRSPEVEISNATIGAVAMLAITEGYNSNHAELRIHMDALKRMVHMRGLANLKGDIVLQALITWLDLMSSTMLAEPPSYTLAPPLLPSDTDVAIPTTEAPDLGLMHETCPSLSLCFRDMRDLTLELITQNRSDVTSQQVSRLDSSSFFSMRKALDHRLLSLKLAKPASKMTGPDCQFEICRIAALIYGRLALPLSMRNDAMVRSLKSQVMELLQRSEGTAVIDPPEQQPNVLIWALFMVCILSSNEEEEYWIARRIAKRALLADIETWIQMEYLLGEVCWMNKLNTDSCKRLWRRVEGINAGYWATRIGSVHQEWIEVEDP